MLKSTNLRVLKQKRPLFGVPPNTWAFDILGTPLNFDYLTTEQKGAPTWICSELHPSLFFWGYMARSCYFFRII